MTTSHLTPCVSCGRHVRANDNSCPFCGASIALTPAPVLPTTRLSRAGLVAFGIAVAASQASCAGSTNNGATVTQGGNTLTSGGEGASTGTGVNADAGSVVSTDDPNQADAATDATADAAQDSPNVVPVYGAPVARYGAPAIQEWEA